MVEPSVYVAHDWKTKCSACGRAVEAVYDRDDKERTNLVARHLSAVARGFCRGSLALVPKRVQKP